MDLVFLNMLDLFIVKFLLFKSSFWKWYKTTFFFSSEDVLVESHGFKSIVVIKKLNNLKAQKKWLFFSLCNPYSKGRTLKKFFSVNYMVKMEGKKTTGVEHYQNEYIC